MDDQVVQMQTPSAEPNHAAEQAPIDGHQPSLSPDPSPPSEPEEQPSSPDSSSSLPPASQPSSASRPDPSTPIADSERHPKGKRKRTAAKDKAILEAAYLANTKPDKAARLEIVQRVSLNEKEVQIWFQNRRQNDRRKSRPLSPQELAALRYGGMHVVLPDTVPFNSTFCSDNTDPSPSQNMPPPEHAAVSPSQFDSPMPQPDNGTEKAQELVLEGRPWEDGEIASARESVMFTPYERVGREPRQMLSRSFSGAIGYLANRWNTASSFSTPTPLDRDTSFRHEVFSSSCPPSTSSASAFPLPGSQPSKFRLSMSLDGKAEVVPSIPSPPRPIAAPPTPDALQNLPPVPRPGLHRRHSALAVALPPFSELTSALPPANSGPLPPRLTRGRSRDVHAWEFCCDSENREDALTAQAKHESRGSAIAAISLLRSTSSAGSSNSSSSSSPLQPSSSAKRNATMSRTAARGGMAKKAKLSRSASSVARMQTSAATTTTTTTTTTALGTSGNHNVQRSFGRLAGSKPKPTNNTALPSLSGHDSDKENWSPDEDGNPRLSVRGGPRINGSSLSSAGRRPLPSGPSRLDRKNPRRTPGRHSIRSGAAPFLSSRANTAPASRSHYHHHHQQYRRGKNVESPLEIYEDDSDDHENNNRVLDDEVERFMRGDVSPSKKGDVDAVAGLLSLSQGNWR